MNYLLLYAHPNPESFNHAVLESAKAALSEKGHTVRTRDLYAQAFAPILSAADLAAFHGGRTPADIKAEQDEIAWADHLVVIYPLWWTGMPAILKGYIDRVLAYGFAYSAGAAGIVPLLKGKSVTLFTTQGTPSAIYEQMGNYDAFYKTVDRGIFEFCGFEIKAHRHFGAVPSTDDDTRKGYLAEVKAVLQR